MPVAVSYPGVYIEEISSGVRTIAGVSTSIAAFVGWAPQGPVDRAQRILSWSDYERKFGGLDRRSLLGYSVYQFFANGGQDAYVIRLVQSAPVPVPVPVPVGGGGGAGGGAAGAPVAAVAASVTLAPLTVTAKNPGVWGNNYGVTIKARTDPGQTNRFRLEVVYIKPGETVETTVESFENLSIDRIDRRFVEAVVTAESSFINVSLAAGAAAPPAPTPTKTTAPKLVGGVDGDVLDPGSSAFEAALLNTKGGVNHLDRVDLFNLLCVPGEADPTTLSSLEGYCRTHRALLIADCAESAKYADLENGPNPSLTGDNAINAALYFPWINAPDPLQENRQRAFPPSGFVAGIYAKTDVNRGVWKAPAGIEASLTGVSGVTQTLTDMENGVLNLKAINCIRNFSVYGTVVWGARTLQGNQERGSEWKYCPVRRTALFLEESLYRGMKWVVFEPNDEPLWAQIRMNAGAFMQGLFRKGAFQGSTPRDAYFVKCDKETTTQDDINQGIVNIVVGFAPLKPAEFVIIKLQQIAGQIVT